MPRTGYVEVVFRFRGADFDTWKAAMDAHEPARVRHGAVGHWIARSIGDPNEFIGVVEFTSRGGARGYADDPDRMDVQRALRLEGGPHHKTWDESIDEVVDAATYEG